MRVRPSPDEGVLTVTDQLMLTTSPCRPPLLIASDIDGTLLETGQSPSVPVIEAVAAVLDAGHELVLSTGRSLSGALAAARELDVTECWVTASNGAITARLTAGSYDLITVHSVDAQKVVRLVTTTLLDLRIAVEIIGVGFRVTEPFPVGELNGDQVTIAQLSDLWAEPAPRLALYGRHANLLVPVLRAAGFTAIATRPDWVDITPGGVSKATAVEHVRLDLGIAIERTVALGDGENDIDLLQWAWLGVAMGNSSSTVQAAADAVTGTVEQAGAVRVLRSIAGNYELIDDSLFEWANRAELKPRRARKGEDASAAGRAQLEAAGYTHEAD